MNAADVVTVGSEYLGDDARNFHRNVFVLDNPVDIEFGRRWCATKAELKRVGWFGTPAGLIDLRAVKTAEPIETITRGGDIEFDLKSIDRTLTAFDLLLLPVEHNKWNLAKNANRMTKAVALGVPVLATATPAHIATVEALGLDDRFLVREGETWDGKIAGLRQDFSAVQDAVLRARGRAIELFAMQRIGGDWLQHIERALDAKTAAAAATRIDRPGARGRCARHARLPQRQAPASGRTAFRSAAVMSSRQRRPAIISSCSTRCGRRSHRSSRTGYCSSRKAFTPRWALPASCARDAKRAGLPCVRGAKPGAWLSRRRMGRLRQGFARNALPAARSRPGAGAPVVAHAAALAAGGMLQLLDLDSARAGSQRGGGRCRRNPGRLARQGRRQSPISVSEYASWAMLHGGRPVELPYPDMQWRRLSIDVLASVAERLPVPVSAAFAWMASDLQTAPNANGSTSIDALGRAAAGAPLGLHIGILATDVTASRRGEDRATHRCTITDCKVMIAPTPIRGPSSDKSRRLTLALCPSDTAYDYELAKLPHDIVLLGNTHKQWDSAIRPLPDNVRVSYTLDDARGRHSDPGHRSMEFRRDRTARAVASACATAFVVRRSSSITAATWSMAARPRACVILWDTTSWSRAPTTAAELWNVERSRVVTPGLDHKRVARNRP